MDDLELGRKAPQHIDMEKNILSAIIVDGESIDDIIDIISVDAFYLPRHQLIYDAALRIHQEGKPIDIAILGEKLNEMGKLADCGGVQYLIELSNILISSSNIEFHARIVAQKYIQRELIKLGNNVIKKSFDDREDVFDTLEYIDSVKNALLNDITDEPLSAIEIFKECVDKIAELKNNSIKDKITGTDTHFVELNSMTAGFQPGELIVVAGRPGSGKTSFMLKQGLKTKKKAVVFSLEMPSYQLVERAISNMTDIDNSRIKTGEVSDDEYKAILRSRDGLVNLIIDDSVPITVNSIKSKVKKIIKEQGEVDIVMIDYLQLIHPSENGKKKNREGQIADISQSLKIMAKELKIPIMALAQLSRESEKRNDKRPLLSDLRESGAIEQDADMVIFLHRPEYYDANAVDADGNSLKGVAELIVAKNRSGRTGTVKAKFIGETMKFKDENEQAQTFIPIASKISPRDIDDFDSKFTSN